MKRILLLSFLLLFMVSFVAQAQRTVSGTIKATEDGAAIPGVNVVLKGTATGTTSDLDGNYRLSVPNDGGTLVFSFIGLVAQEVQIGSRSVVDVSMASDVTELESVVVTALGVERSEKAVGFAVQEVESDALVNSGAASAVDALQGKVSGVQITRSSGSVGAGSRIVIRGVTSIQGNNQPLIVIDGVRTNNETLFSEGNTAGTAQSNRLMDLNVEDIESVSVLKGAAATSIYGTAGSTGVILITTKRARKGSGLQVNLSHQFSMDWQSGLFPLQGEFGQGRPTGYRDPSTGESGSWGPRISDLEYSTDRNHPDAPNNSNAFDADGNYKWDRNGFLVPRGTGNGIPANNYESKNQDDFFQMGVGNTTNISVAGGGEYATFRFSASNLDASGIVPNEEYKRKTVKLTSSLQATDRLSFQSSFNYSRSDFIRVQQGSNTSGLLLGLYRTTSTFDNANGLSAEDARDNPLAYIFPTGQQRTYRGGGGYDNPYWIINNALRDEFVNRFFGNIQVNYNFNQWLNLGMNIGTDFTSDVRTQNFEIGSRTAPSGRIVQDEFTTHQTDFYLNLSGQGKLTPDIGLNYLAGINAFDFQRHNQFTRGNNLIFQGFVDISNAATIDSEEDDFNYRQLGFFGQVEANFKEQVFLTLTGRQDYDSRLGVPGDINISDMGFFYPSISGSWLFSELFDSDILSFGKVRASWARVGAPPPFAYLTVTNYETNAISDGWSDANPWPINGLTSFELDNTLGNSELTPEFSETWEFGVDLRFLNGVLGLDVAYFQTKTTDAILNASLATSTGFSAIWLNAGQMDSEGWEITLDATPISTPDFTWNTQLNWTRNESIVKELAPGLDNLFLAGFNSAGSYVIAGEQYGAIRGGAYLREGAGGPEDTGLALPPGQIVVVDDPESSSFGYEAIDPVQRAIGNPNPDFILGWNNSLSYKGVNLNFLFDWRQGGDVWNGTAWALSFFGRSELTAETRQETPFAIDGVKSDGSPNDIEIVRDRSYWTSGVGGFGDVGEQFVQDGGWIRLREVSVGYSLPRSVLGDGFIKGVSISAIGRNLWWESDYEGIDPETSLTGNGNGQGFDYFNMPSTRSLIFKVSVDL
ncbi:MAG: SusC/RagA family TonB-linked outer membrane protein [Bacteroidota bacterium]